MRKAMGIKGVLGYSVGLGALMAAHCVMFYLEGKSAGKRELFKQAEDTLFPPMSDEPPSDPSVPEPGGSDLPASQTAPETPSAEPDNLTVTDPSEVEE